MVVKVLADSFVPPWVCRTSWNRLSQSAISVAGKLYWGFVCRGIEENYDDWITLRGHTAVTVTSQFPGGTNL